MNFIKSTTRRAKFHIRVWEIGAYVSLGCGVCAISNLYNQILCIVPYISAKRLSKVLQKIDG
jgi:diaminopimelate epimerase